MKHCAVVLLFLLAAIGCGRKKADAPSAVSTFQTTALPVPPPIPTLVPVSNDVEGAKTDVESAQKNVQAVLSVARASDAPVAQQAVPPLSNADTQLTSAGTKLDSAIGRIGTLESAIKASEQARESNDKARLNDIKRLEQACKLDNATSEKRINTLTKENQDLKDEDLQYAKNRLRFIGVALLLLGIGGFVSIFALSFPGGKYIGMIAFPMGVCCLAIAQMLTTIVWYAEVGMVAAALIALAVGAYHLFHHDPKPKGDADEKVSAA